ncbi:MAG: histidine kinase [Armatimonadota bacterium]|nr:histidine kinase [Armatimonadota bacterium]
MRGGIAVPIRYELFHERALAERIALVRFILTAADLVVISVFDIVPSDQKAVAVGASLLFMTYAIFAWWLVKTERVQVDLYQLISPIFDLLAASVLVVATGGFQSPFNMWFVFAVVGTGFTRFRYLPLITMAVAIALQYAIAQIPLAAEVVAAIPGTTGPIDVPRNLLPDQTVFFASMVNRFGVAAVIAFVSSYLTNLSKTVAIVEEAGRLLGDTVNERDAARVFLWKASELLGLTYGKLTLADGPSFEVGSPNAVEGVARRTWQIIMGGDNLGELTGERPAAFGQREDTLAEIMCERGATTLKRINLANDLISSAADAERSRIADQLHDTYLQTLAAMDLRAEAARQLRNRAEIDKELVHLKEIARGAARQAREVIQGATPRMLLGRERIEKVLRDRWAGDYDLKLSDDVALTEGQWRAIEMLLREGLNNAKKHGKASRVTFTIRQVGEKLTIRLEDNGKGSGEMVALGYGLQRLRAVFSEQGGMLTLEPGARGAALVAEIWMGAKSA